MQEEAERTGMDGFGRLERFHERCIAESQSHSRDRSSHAFITNRHQHENGATESQRAIAAARARKDHLEEKKRRDPINIVELFLGEQTPKRSGIWRFM